MELGLAKRVNSLISFYKKPHTCLYGLYQTPHAEISARTAKIPPYRDIFKRVNS